MPGKFSRSKGAPAPTPTNKQTPVTPQTSSLPQGHLPDMATMVGQNIIPVVTEAQRQAVKTSFSGRKAVSRGTIFLALYAWLLSGGLLLALIARRTDLFPGDRSITAALQKRRSPWFRRFMYGISEIGFWQWTVPGTIGTAGIFWALRFRLEALFILLTSSSHLMNAVVKRAIKRPRPDKELVTVVRVINEPSFPSGHVMHYTNFYGLLIYLLATNWRSGRLRNTLIAICTGLITLVGPSRIYLGAHWPSDVAAGYLFGGLWFGGIMALYLRVKSWLHPPKGTPPPPDVVNPLKQPGDDDE